MKRFDQKMKDFIIDENDIPFIDCSGRMIYGLIVAKFAKLKLLNNNYLDFRPV